MPKSSEKGRFSHHSATLFAPQADIENLQHVSQMVRQFNQNILQPAINTLAHRNGSRRKQAYLQNIQKDELSYNNSNPFSVFVDEYLTKQRYACDEVKSKLPEFDYPSLVREFWDRCQCQLENKSKEPLFECDAVIKQFAKEVNSTWMHQYSRTFDHIDRMVQNLQAPPNPGVSNP